MSNAGYDPYKPSRNTSKPGSYGNSAGQFASHSTNGHQQSNNYYANDPYAPHSSTQHHYSPDSHSMMSSNRSPTPSKHHHKNPSHKGSTSNSGYSPSPVAMYQEGSPLPSYVAPNTSNDMVYSPQDNIAMDMDDSAPLHTFTTTTKDKPQDIRERGKFCGVGRKNWVTITFAILVIVVIVWYFVWPRAFEMDLNTVSLYGNNTNHWTTTTSSTGTITTKEFQTVWNISMVADNKDNWVPTRVAGLDLAIFDHDTGIKFANATVGSFVLGAKETKPINFVATIDFLRATNEPTMDDFTAACQSSSQQKTPSSLNLLFQVTYHISGFIWSYQTQTTSSYFLCPQ
ncbi:hypothetical protein BC941DRAFT_425672 [Chlamydoabsidia padenii]|nr:hypothetical protein BC941DRAFT_425672 [Chlamydoabsidia padenii]